MRYLFCALIGICLLFATGVVGASQVVTETILNEPVFGGQVLVREAGRDNPELLLLVHGLGDEAGSTWEPLLSDLAQHYHVVVPDLPGFGRSSKGNHLYSPEAYARFLDWLIAGLPDKPLTLVGHSLGGGISLVYAAVHGQGLKELVLVDSVGLLHYLAVSQHYIQKFALDSLFVAPVSSRVGKVANLILEKTSYGPLKPSILLSSALMREKFLAADPARIAGLALVQTDYSQLLGRIQVPTWLLWGGQDRVAPLRIAEILNWHLPRSQLLLLPAAGHVPMKDDPDQFLRALRRALQHEPVDQSELGSYVNGRIGLCEGERGRVFSGEFERIEISSCQDVQLRNVKVRGLLVEDSTVAISRSHLSGQGSEPALKAVRSKLTLTAVDIVAEIGVLTDQSRLDLAGVRFIDAHHAVMAVGNPSSLLSSSSTRAYRDEMTSLHLSRSLSAGESL